MPEYMPASHPHWSIRETATFLDPGFHKTKQEEFDGDIKDRPTSSKNWYNTMWVGKITNELEEVLGVERTVVAQLSIIAYHCPLI